jgi:hypothetical protein
MLCRLCASMLLAECTDTQAFTDSVQQGEMVPLIRWT